MTVYRYKIMLIGPAAVGKTSLLYKFVKNEFKENYMLTIGVQFLTKELKFKKDEAKLQVWDIGGQERFKGVRKQFYTGAAGALLVFDLTRYQTFEQMNSWLTEMYDSLPHDVPFILIGNKVDLIESAGRAVESEAAETFAKSKGSIYIETSAKDGINVDEAFVGLTKIMASSKGKEIR